MKVNLDVLKDEIPAQLSAQGFRRVQRFLPQRASAPYRFLEHGAQSGFPALPGHRPPGWSQEWLSSTISSSRGKWWTTLWTASRMASCRPRSAARSSAGCARCSPTRASPARWRLSYDLRGTHLRLRSPGRVVWGVSAHPRRGGRPLLPMTGKERKTTRWGLLLPQLKPVFDASTRAVVVASGRSQPGAVPQFRFGAPRSGVAGSGPPGIRRPRGRASFSGAFPRRPARSLPAEVHAGGRGPAAPGHPAGGARSCSTATTTWTASPPW